MTKKTCPVWVRIGAMISGTAFAALVMETASKWSFLITAVLAFAVLGFLMLRMDLLPRLLRPMSPVLQVLALIIAASAVYTGKSAFYATCWAWVYRLVTLMHLPHPWFFVRLSPWIVALLALPMTYCYLHWFTGFIADLFLRLWRESDFTERLFLLGAGLLFTMMIVFTYTCTQAFYGAHINGRWFNFDLIYASDSGYLVHQDVYRNIGAEQNDLRQPLFGLAAMPFAQVAWLVSRLLPFLGRPYITIWQIIQLLLFLVAMVMLSRLLKLQAAEKALFLVFICVCWPTLIFALTAEQYLTSVFYLILMLYLAGEQPGNSLGFIAATGSLLTSGVWFPVVTRDRDFKVFVKKTVMLCLAFFAVTILCGRLTTFLDMPGYIREYGYYSGADVSPVQKLMQFVTFAGACIAAPPSAPDFTAGRASWQMLPVTGWSWVGILVLALSIGGIIAGRRERLSRYCGAWIAFALLLLGIVGWGTIDNGLMLYSLYFGWAFAAMTFQLIDRVFSRVRPLKLVVMALLAMGLVSLNVNALHEVLVFGTRVYPTLTGGLP